MKSQKRTLEQFLGDRDLQAIVERRFEILGEARRRLDRVDGSLLAQIPGARQAIGLRNIISHGYDGVDHRLLWDTMTVDLDPMRAAIASLLG